MITTSKIVIGGSYCQIKLKTKTNTRKTILPGFISPWLIVFLFLLIAGIYVYCINNGATKGSQIKQIENEISRLEKENEQLKIKEAELKSLYRLEQSSKTLNMITPVEISYLEEKSAMAMK